MMDATSEMFALIEAIQTGGIIALLIIGIARMDRMRKQSEMREDKRTEEFIRYLKARLNDSDE